MKKLFTGAEMSLSIGGEVVATAKDLTYKREPYLAPFISLLKGATSKHIAQGKSPFDPVFKRVDLKKYDSIIDELEWL